MAKNMHGFEIIVNADKSDWGIKWGLAPVGDPLCWCYECSMTRPTKYAPDAASAASAEPDSGSESVSAVESDTQPRG